MKVLEAKDFLVQQTAEQAALENVPLTDLEKRMMYFTETDECPEDPIALNDGFEAEYDTDKYEEKVSGLLRHAYARLKKRTLLLLAHGMRLFGTSAKATITCLSF